MDDRLAINIAQVRNEESEFHVYPPIIVDPRAWERVKYAAVLHATGPQKPGDLWVYLDGAKEAEIVKINAYTSVYVLEDLLLQVPFAVWRDVVNWLYQHKIPFSREAQ